VFLLQALLVNFSPPTVPSVNKSIYSHPFSLYTQFLSHKATENGVGSVSFLLLRALSHRQNCMLVLRYWITHHY